MNFCRDDFAVHGLTGFVEDVCLGVGQELAQVALGDLPAAVATSMSPSV